MAMKRNETRRKRRLSVDDIDELIEMAEDEKVRRFWHTIKEERLRGGNPRIASSRYRKFISVPIYNNSIVVIFILAILSFATWFLFNYTSINIPIDITQVALVVAFAFSAIMFHRYVTDKEEIVGMLDELAGYSIQNESVFENIGSALMVVDAAGKVTKVNRKAEEILEAKNRELVGKNCQQIFTNAELGGLIIKTLRSSDRAINHEVNLKSSGGKHYSLQITTSHLQNKKGYTIGVIAVINDVTEMRELQEKLKLNEHLASIGELAAKLGHEIGNSLGGIKLFTDNLMDELPPEDSRREYAAEILSEIDRLKISINDLKNYSRPINLELRKTSINQMMDEALSLIMDKIKENNISIEKHLSYNLPDLMIDPDQVKGALMNIMINAIQAMPEGGILEVSTRRWNGVLELSVGDTGMGIPEDIRSKIFNPFFTTKKALGTGLGLSIAYKTIKSHGGTIRFDSEVDRGTIFTIELPVNAIIGEQ